VILGLDPAVMGKSSIVMEIFFFWSHTHTFSVSPSRSGYLPLCGDQVDKREIDAILYENHVKANIT
jgi:hypothetical protein